MTFNEIAFVVLVGAGFILLAGLLGLFEALMDYLFDRQRVAHRAHEVKKTIAITFGALGVCLIAWIFI